MKKLILSNWSFLFLRHSIVVVLTLLFLSQGPGLYSQAPSVDCANAPVLTVGGACGSGAIADAVLEPGVNNANLCGSGQTVFREGWYKFQATGTAANITGTVTGRNLGLQIFSGTCGSLTEIGCDNSTTTTGADVEYVDATGLIPGNWYYIRVVNMLSSSMTLTSLCVTNLVIPPNNDPCGAIPLTVGTSCSYTTFNNLNSTVSVGIAQPGCGNYISNDVWFSAVIPADGTLNLQAIDGPSAGTFYPAIAIYEGTCSTLVHQGCQFNTTIGFPTTATYVGPPGSTVYIRIWDYYAAEGDFNLCAYTHTNTSGTVFAGANNTVPCGGPALTFMDPGGSGNYYINSSATYTICPSVPGQYVSVSFSSFNLENQFDYLTVINGAGPNSPIVGNYTGATLPPVITSSSPDGCLTFSFRSDNINVSSGWVASVTCSATPGTNTPFCSTTNCSGGCGTWFCGDGLYPTNNSGSVGVQEFGEQVAGCLGGAGEVATAWFYFTALTTGTIAITFDGPNGQDYDFAIWGPNTSGQPPCPFNTGQSPIRCSFANVSNTGNPVGLASGAGDYYEGPEGNGFVEDLDVIAGETYALVLNIYQNGNPQPVIDLNVTGTGTLDCTPLPIELLSFNGIYDAGYNRVRWSSAAEFNNDYYTLFYSNDAVNWDVLTTNPGAGNSNMPTPYAYSHISPYAITYYKLRQTDYDGQFKEFGPISISKMSNGTELNLSIYPNPVSDQLNLFSDYEGELTISLYDNLGRMVLNTTKPGAGIHQINISNVEPGIYYLNVVSQFGVERIEKLVIQ